MKNRSDDPARLEELVAGLHGEQGSAPRPEDALEQDAVATLRDLDEALRALGADTRDAWRSTESTLAEVSVEALDRPPARRGSQVLGWLLAVAAAAVLVGVFVIARLDPELDAQVVGRGDDLVLRCSPLHGGHGPMHAALGFHLEIEAHDGRDVVITPRDPAAGPSLGEEPGFATLVGGMGVWYVQIDVVVRDPGGHAFHGFIVPAGLPETGRTGSPLELDVHLFDIWVDDAGPTPYVSVFDDDQGRPEVDFRRGFARYGMAAVDGYQPFLPRTPGRHEVEFTVRGLWGRSAAALVNPNAAPTTVRHAFVVDGAASPWSAPVDGLRARWIGPGAACSRDADWPLALQIENVGELDRRYNVLGSTAAPIPQPFHLRLFVDGAEATQREGRPVLIPARWFREHPAGTVLTMLVSPRSIWSVEELDWSAGRHGLALELDTRPLLAAPDPAHWQGRLRTPEATVRLR